MSGIWLAVSEAIEESTGEPSGSLSARGVGGGCINEAHLVTTESGQEYFVKLNASHKVAMFEAEMAGLQEMAATKTIRVPLPIACGVEGSSAFLILEALRLQSRGDAELMGQQLAALHRQSSVNGMFGWDRDNMIGETPQVNAWTDDWLTFWLEHRLGYQVELAARKGLQLRKLETLLENAESMYQGYRPVPSLVHGDLWGGNAGFDQEGQPVLFDPATYYGDREVDLAFTRMFGGFSPDFYRGYEEAWPLDAGFERRLGWYNLYHELNHYNLFGGGYGSQAQNTVERLVRDLS